jgi:hypothetical protein
VLGEGSRAASGRAVLRTIRQTGSSINKSMLLTSVCALTPFIAPLYAKDPRENIPYNSDGREDDFSRSDLRFGKQSCLGPPSKSTNSPSRSPLPEYRLDLRHFHAKRLIEPIDRLNNLREGAVQLRGPRNSGRRHLVSRITSYSTAKSLTVLLRAAIDSYKIDLLKKASKYPGIDAIGYVIGMLLHTVTSSEHTRRDSL